MNISFEFDANKVWLFLENYNLLPQNNFMTSKELFENLIENNPNVLIKYSAFEYDSKSKSKFTDKQIFEKRSNLSSTKLSKLNEDKLEELPSFYDIEYWNSSKIFEAEEIRAANLTPDEIQKAEKAYHEILESLQEGKELDEGFLTGLLGGAAGALAGPAIGRAILKILGIKEDGHLGRLLTSRLVTAAIGYELGS